MDKFDQQEERLLEQGSNDGEQEKDSRLDYHTRSTKGRGIDRYVSAITSCLLVASIVWNIVLIGTVRTLDTQRSGCKSSFAGLEYDKTISYQMMTDFMNQNRSISDVLWTELDSHPILVALDKEYISSHGLCPSAKCPQDNKKQLYQVKGLHHMHCLKSIRMAYFDALENKYSMPPQHVAHCLDVLRQDIICAADDSPTPFHKHGHESKGGEPRQCRNWNRLLEWTMQEGRQSCFSKAER